MKTEELHQSLLKLESNLTDLQAAREQVIGLAELNVDIQQSSMKLLTELKQINSSLNNKEDGFIRTVFESIKGFSVSVYETVNKLNELRVTIDRISNIKKTDLNEPIENILSNVTELNHKQDYNKSVLSEVKEDVSNLSANLILEISSLESNLKPEFKKITHETTAQNSNVQDKLSLIIQEIHKGQLSLSKLELTVIDISVKIDQLVNFLKMFQSEIDEKLSLLGKSLSEIKGKIDGYSTTLNEIYSELSSIRETQQQINDNIQLSNKQLNQKINIQTIMYVIGFVAIILLILAK